MYSYFFLNIALANEVKRIITLSPSAVEMLYAIGAGDRIVGTVEYSDFPEQAKDILRIGNYKGVQIEKIVALKPDLVVTWESGNQLADIKKLKSLGIPTFNSSPRNIPDLAEQLIRLGKITGTEEKAKIAADSILAKFHELKGKYGSKDKVKVFYQLWHDPMRTVGPTSWISTLISDCNGENIFNDTDAGYPLVSLESIVVKNPQVIIIPHHSGEVGAKQEVWNNWKNVDAVKHQRLSIVDGGIMLRLGPRIIEGLELMCEAIDDAR